MTQAVDPKLADSRAFRPATYRHFHRIAWLAVALALGVIVFGAFVRLSNAGLSCPDWPTCYGRAAWPTAAHEIVDHAATAIRPVEPHKAWREQLHRMLAGALGLLVLTLALLAARRRRFGIAQVLAAAALVAVGHPALHARRSTSPRRSSPSPAKRCCCSPRCAGATSTWRASPR